jgi:hypothetical protein
VIAVTIPNWEESFGHCEVSGHAEIARRLVRAPRPDTYCSRKVMFPPKWHAGTHSGVSSGPRSALWPTARPVQRPSATPKRSRIVTTSNQSQFSQGAKCGKWCTFQAGAVFNECSMNWLCHLRNCLKRMVGTTGLEPETSAVTVPDPTIAATRRIGRSGSPRFQRDSTICYPVFMWA